MYPKQSVTRDSQKGVGLPATVFLIVIVALIVLALGELNTKSNLGFGQDFYSIKAFYAAESGAQVALNKVFMGEQACGAGLVSVDFDTNTNKAGLENCNVNVSCTASTVDSVDYYTFTSAAVCGAGYEQAQRSIEVRARSE